MCKVSVDVFGSCRFRAPRHDPNEFIDSAFIDRLKQEKFVDGSKHYVGHSCSGA